MFGLHFFRCFFFPFLNESWLSCQIITALDVNSYQDCNHLSHGTGLHHLSKQHVRKLQKAAAFCVDPTRGGSWFQGRCLRAGQMGPAPGWGQELAFRQPLMPPTLFLSPVISLLSVMASVASLGHFQGDLAKLRKCGEAEGPKL